VIRRAALLLGGLVLLTAAPLLAAPAQPPVEITGATYAEFDARTDTWLLRGHPVVIARGATRIEAAEVRYRAADGVAVATGNVTVRHETLRLRASAVEGRLREERVIATGRVEALVHRPDGDATVSAERVEADLRRRHLVATGQPALAHREFSLHATRLEYEDAAQVATAEGRAELQMPEGRLEAGRIRARLAEERAEARDGVRLVSEDLTVESPQVDVDQARGVAVFSGGATARRGGDVLVAAQITVDLRARRAVATGTPRLVVTPP